MKHFFLIALLGLAACQEEKPIWDQLTELERDAVREEAERECTLANQSRFDAIKNSTGFFQSTTWQRNKAFKHELKNGETVDTLNEIQVWKQDTAANIVYLWVKQTKGSDLDSFFIRITKTQHENMVDGLLKNLCARTITATSSTNPIPVTKSYTQTATPNKREFTDTYSIQLDETPFVGGTYRLTRKIVTKKIADDAVVSTLNLASTFTSVAEPEVLGSNPNSYATIYCDLVEPVVTVPATAYSLPFAITCSSSLPGGWNLTI